MKPWKSVFVACISLGLLTGCSTKQDLITRPSANHRELIVLLPDPDGKVGSIHVTTKGGSQTLQIPRQSTQVEDFSKPPTVPKALNEGDIMSVFSPTLSGQPDPTGRYVSFLLYFESDTSKLTRESKELLPEIVRTINNRKSKEVYVVGHTDRLGTTAYNRGLSSRRANYVRDQLLSSGVKLGALVVSSHGEAIPLINTEDEVAEPLNRRVEVIVR